jgi:hypothetical protein
MLKMRGKMTKFFTMATLVLACTLTGARAQGMLLDYAADRVIEKYQTATCDQLKQSRAEGPNEKEKAALTFLRGDEQARTEFINRIAAPVANKMFECGMFP